MGAALSSPAAFGIAMVALPATALLAPTNYAIFFTVALLAVGMQTSSMQAQMDKIPADRRAYYKRLLGMAIIGLSAMGMSAVVTYGGVRHSLASADALTMLNGAWQAYRGLRLSYMVLLTVFIHPVRLLAELGHTLGDGRQQHNGAEQRAIVVAGKHSQRNTVRYHFTLVLYPSVFDYQPCKSCGERAGFPRCDERGGRPGLTKII